MCNHMVAIEGLTFPHAVEHPFLFAVFNLMMSDYIITMLDTAAVFITADEDMSIDEI
jgi:hypothetical protein